MTATTTEIRELQQEVAERFARETANHEMTVMHDDGLYRHLRFRDPKYSEYWFDLITVPGALIFQGDGETFLFRRVEDMFEFFRSGIYKDGTLHINPGYWAEKLTTDRDSVKRYDEKLFEQHVAEYFEEAEAEKEFPGITEAWKAKFDGVFPDYSAYTEEDARAALDDFEYGQAYQAKCRHCGDAYESEDKYAASRWESDHYRANGSGHRSSVHRVEGFRFIDTEDWNLRGYYWWFLWACHAIVWGIAQYDAARAGEASDAKAVA